MPSRQTSGLPWQQIRCRRTRRDCLVRQIGRATSVRSGRSLLKNHTLGRARKPSRQWGSFCKTDGTSAGGDGSKEALRAFSKSLLSLARVRDVQIRFSSILAPAVDSEEFPNSTVLLAPVVRAATNLRENHSGRRYVHALCAPAEVIRSARRKWARVKPRGNGERPMPSLATNQVNKPPSLPRCSRV